MQSEANAIRAELDRVLSDPAFSGANRRSRLLRYLVEETLEDRGASLKESVIATDVFDRSADYDPQVDSVVRVEVGRLRARLAEYYEKAGARDGVRIEIPKGGYRPVFVFREIAETSPQPPPRRGVAPIAAAIVLIAILAVVFWRTRVSPPAGITTVAVLPFLNLSGNNAYEYLSDGVSDELTEVLAESRDLRVVARTSAFQYKGKSVDIREIGRNLRAGAILEGSIARSDNGRVRVIAQLIRASDGYHLWSHTYDGEMSEIPQIENEITRALREKLLPSSATPARPIPARNPEAHDLYIRAAYDLNQHTIDATRQAIDLAHQAQAMENSAPTLVLLASAELELATLFAQPAGVSANRAWDDVGQALAIDPDNSTAHALKALLAYTDRWDWPTAESEFRLALATGSHAAAENLYGWCLMTRGRFSESRQRLQTASDLDPLSLGPQLNQVSELIAEHDDAHARRTVDQILRVAPANPVALILGLDVAYWQRDCAAATSFNEKSHAQFPQVAHPTLGDVVASAACGRSDEVARDLNVLGKTKPSDFPSPYLAAETFALGNDSARAISLLELSASQRESRLLQLKVDRVFEPLQTDPRFLALERRIGLLR